MPQTLLWTLAALCGAAACDGGKSTPKDGEAADSAGDEGGQGASKTETEAPLTPELKTTAPDLSGYRSPGDEVRAIVEAPRTPSVSVDPTGKTLLLDQPESLPSITAMARPFLGLAGRRIDPQYGAPRRTTWGTGFTLVSVADKKTRAVELPEGARTQGGSFSPDGQHIAFSLRLEDGYQPWILEVESGQARALCDCRLASVLAASFVWAPERDAVLMPLRPEGLGKAPARAAVRSGPAVQDTSGRKAQNRTYQDLLTSKEDEALFTHYATSQLSLVSLDPAKSEVQTLGAPGLHTSADFAPDGEHLLVETLSAPFSYAVPYWRFPQSIEVWSIKGEGAQVKASPLHTLAELDLAEEVPIGGVRTGPRSVQWDPHASATLVWAEALDGGDPKADVPHRDQLLSWAAPFEGQASVSGKTEQRFSDLWFTPRAGERFVAEYDRDRRWTKATWFAPGQSEGKVVIDHSIHDRYGDPGRPLWAPMNNGRWVLRMDQPGQLWMRGAGATEDGDRPFLDRWDLASGDKERVFESEIERYGSVLSLLPRAEGAAADAPPELLFWREAPKEPRNLYHQRGEEVRPLTEFKDPHPQLTGIEKRLLKYKRKDGVPLSGTLYIPPGWDGKERLPLIVWAYPLEYTDKKVAGQVRARPNRFTRLAGSSPLMFLTQGYAVLDGAAMPIVGDPETMNDTFIKQIVDAAKAAIDAAAAEGVADPNRVAVAGHSYGAFMTANLLAHSDLFKAGIARSGAYNRTLTPFGFQSERRTLWEATPSYLRVSPLFSADKIDEPLLLIHGEEDANSGTYPLQSKRLFHAMSGLGGTARLVMLPEESHGYRSKESILHVLAESFEWMDTHVRGEAAPGNPKVGD